VIIKQPETIKAIVETLAREHALRVLESASEREMTVPGLVSELRIPSSSAYLLVSELEKAGLLSKIRSEIRDDGKRFDVWRTAVAAVNLSIEGNCILELTPRRDMVGRFLRLWRTIAGEQSG